MKSTTIFLEPSQFYMEPDLIRGLSTVPLQVTQCIDTAFLFVE